MVDDTRYEGYRIASKQVSVIYEFLCLGRGG